MFCIQVPMLETSAPVQNKVKLRWRKATTASPRPRFGGATAPAAGTRGADAGATRAGALVHLPRAEPDVEVELPDPRRSDVDEWGRSESMRELARRVYDPLYRYWFRAEWEGLEKIPRDGGALIIANHAAA